MMDARAAQVLIGYFRSGGYVRRPNKARKKEGANVYKKGCEVRLVLENMREVDQVRRALEALGFKPGKVFAKHSKLVQPVYGARALDWFTGRA